jgi:hypothetical protein
VTRAWRLVKFVDNGMLTMTKCSKCGGHFVTHPHEIARHYVCGLCNPPARAGKGKLAGSLGMNVAGRCTKPWPWPLPGIDHGHELIGRSSFPGVSISGMNDLFIARLLLAQSSVLSAGPSGPAFLRVASRGQPPRPVTPGHASQPAALQHLSAKTSVWDLMADIAIQSSRKAASTHDIAEARSPLKTRPVPAEYLRFGEGLPFGVRDAAGRLLLAAGR